MQTDTLYLQLVDEFTTAETHLHMWGGSLGMVDRNGADRRTEGHLTYMDSYIPTTTTTATTTIITTIAWPLGGSRLVSNRGTPVELVGTRLTWLMSPRHSPPVRRSGSHGKASRHCLTLFYPTFKMSCSCTKGKLSSANGMQNVFPCDNAGISRC